MFVLRSLIWTCVVMLFVPFQRFDPARGAIEVDRAALMAQIQALPEYCTHNGEVCRKAGDVFALMRQDGEELVSEVFNARNLDHAARFAQNVLSADQDWMAPPDRTGLRISP